MYEVAKMIQPVRAIKIGDNISVCQNYEFASHSICWSRNMAADSICNMQLKTFP